MTCSNYSKNPFFFRRRSFCEQMGNNVPSRRMSRATVHLENSNGADNMSFVDAIHLSPYVLLTFLKTN